MKLDLLMRELERDEGRVLKPYEDTVGKITIGVGRNLTDVGISDPEADLLLVNDIDRTFQALDHALPWWRSLDEDRQRVLANMAFNLGVAKLTEFTKTLGLVRVGEYRAAAEAMLASLWARQVGPRATRLAARMRAGGTEEAA